MVDAAGCRGDAATELLQRMPERPMAAASIGQVYRVTLPARRGRRSEVIALKVLRPEARETVAMDAMLARRVASWVEAVKWKGVRVVRPALVDGVDEFFGRLFEEMDYENERHNLQAFDALYGRRGRAARALRSR